MPLPSGLNPGKSERKSSLDDRRAIGLRASLFRAVPLRLFRFFYARSLKQLEIDIMKAAVQAKEVVMSKCRVIAPILGIVIVFSAAVSCIAQDEGIPPAEATIWALNTQLAAQETAAALTLTSLVDDYSATQQAQPLATATIVYPTPVAVNCYVKASRVDLRTGPDLRFPASGQHIAGEQCVISAEYNDWYYVTFPSDYSSGWLYLSWLYVPDLSNLAAISQVPVYVDWRWAQPCKKYCK
jgi:hypothetical protein